MQSLTPKEIVQELDRFIIGQEAAKKAVAIALRNRYRRKKLSTELREEIYPKNIIMIGPTGVGKTEIARRLAKIVKAPFIKVEASKFTEVGYVGRDVDSMIRELVETSIRMVRAEKKIEVEEQALKNANSRLIDAMMPKNNQKNPKNQFNFWFQNDDQNSRDKNEPAQDINLREIIQQKLARFELEDTEIEIETEEKNSAISGMFAGSGAEEMGVNLQDLFSSFLPKNQKKKIVSVAQARKIFIDEEADRLIETEAIQQEATSRVEEDGIIFLDEIDKIAGKDSSHGPDVSREGVQRDILPIVEGSTVITKYGPVKTDHILFIAAGAFHVSKPSDLIPELQGRFPIRVELKNLDQTSIKRILTEPHNSLIKQYIALLSTEQINLSFTEEAIDYITEVVCEVNERTENIGARRLHTVMEKVLEDLLFDAPYLTENTFTVGRDYAAEKLHRLVESEDMSRYIL